MYLKKMSSNSSDFPMPWKISIFVPLPKVTNPLSTSDSIPFSLIPLPGKTLEHILVLHVVLVCGRGSVYISGGRSVFWEAGLGSKS